MAWPLRVEYAWWSGGSLVQLQVRAPWLGRYGIMPIARLTFTLGRQVPVRSGSYFTIVL